MILSPYAIQQLIDYVTGDGHPKTRTGPELISLFNKCGFRDVYDQLGLPDIGLVSGHRPSRKRYAAARLLELSGKPELRDLLNQILAELQDADQSVDSLNEILNPEKFSVVQTGSVFHIEGGVIDNRKPVINEAHFQDIQNRILKALDAAQVSIRVVMAWFTNETLFNKLLDKAKEGLDVRVAIYDDGINKKHGVDIGQIPNDLIKRGQRGGLMHNKFCVIDNQVVITGSYNWSDNAEFKNDENVTVEYDPEQATKFSVEYRRLTT